MLANGGWDLIQRLTLILLTWTKWRAPTNASKWRMGFNSAFKGLTYLKNVFIMCHDVPCPNPSLSRLRFGEWVTENFSLHSPQYGNLCIRISEIITPSPYFMPVCICPAALMLLVNSHHFFICALSFSV